MSDDSRFVRRTQRYEINGRVYDRLEEVPEPYRSMLADKNRDGVPDMFEGVAKEGVAEVIRSETKVTTRTGRMGSREARELGLGLRAGDAGELAPIQSLRCRQCGYDLSSATVSGVCPECGLPVMRSIDPKVGVKVMMSPGLIALLLIGGLALGAWFVWKFVM
jgi:rubrerythrin